MEYNHDLLEIEPAANPGTQEKAKVTQVVKDELQQFVPAEVIEKKWGHNKVNDVFLEIVAEYGVGKIVKKLISYPENEKMVHPKSNIARWKKTYGDFPHVGQDVYVVADGEGVFNFNLLE